MSGTLCRDLANMVERPMPGPVSPLVGPSTDVPHLTAEENGTWWGGRSWNSSYEVYYFILRQRARKIRHSQRFLFLICAAVGRVYHFLSDPGCLPLDRWAA